MSRIAELASTADSLLAAARAQASAVEDVGLQVSRTLRDKDIVAGRAGRGRDAQGAINDLARAVGAVHESRTVAAGVQSALDGVAEAETVNRYLAEAISDLEASEASFRTAASRLATPIDGTYGYPQAQQVRLAIKAAGAESTRAAAGLDQAREALAAMAVPPVSAVSPPAAKVAAGGIAAAAPVQVKGLPGELRLTRDTLRGTRFGSTLDGWYVHIVGPSSASVTEAVAVIRSRLDRAGAALAAHDPQGRFPELREALADVEGLLSLQELSKPQETLRRASRLLREAELVLSDTDGHVTRAHAAVPRLDELLGLAGHDGGLQAAGPAALEDLIRGQLGVVESAAGRVADMARHNLWTDRFIRFTDAVAGSEALTEMLNAATGARVAGEYLGDAELLSALRGMESHVEAGVTELRAATSARVPWNRPTINSETIDALGGTARARTVLESRSITAASEVNTRIGALTDATEDLADDGTRLLRQVADS